MSTSGLLTGIRAQDAKFWYTENGTGDADLLRQFPLPTHMEWNILERQAVLSAVLSYANVQLSHGSERPV